MTGIRMPYMNGFKLYEHIQKIDQSLANRVIVITGGVMGEDTRDFLRKAKASYITKPFDMEQLKEAINRILSQQS